jgi:hypothetical protein
MKILDAVYRSSDRYNAPDNRYGFGIPNFRIAFQLLKKDQNTLLYGNQILFAASNPFQNNLSVYLKAPQTGQADVRLVDAKGSIIETITLQLNENETRNISFTKVRQLARGVYFVQYVSKGVKRTIKLVKL